MLKKEELFKMYAGDPNLTTYHYKVLFMLLYAKRTQSEIAAELNVDRQSINKVCKYLLNVGYIIVADVNGRNKLLDIHSNPNVQING